MKTKTLNFHNLNKRIKPIKSDWLVYILILLFFAGLVIGVNLIKKDDNEILNNIVKLYIDYTDITKVNSSAVLFFKLFLISSFVIFIAYFIGLCAVGIPFVSLIPFLTGIFSGIISGYYYTHYMLKGLGYCMIILFPSLIIFTASVLISCKGSIVMSLSMLNLLSMRRTQPQESFKKYSLKFLILVLLGGLSSFIFTVMTKLFIHIFAF